MILVTGGLGYIGSHTVVELIQAGYEVVIIDDLSNSSEIIAHQIEKITGVFPHCYCFSVQNKEKLTSVFEKHNIEGVIHFAASLLVNESVSNPLKYYQNNLISLLVLLEVMESHSVFNFVYSSSCTVYGNTKELPVSEQSEINKTSSPYGTTKIMGEKIIQDTCKASKKLNAISLRYFNPVGAHDSGLIGEFPKVPNGHIFPALINVLEGKNKRFKVFGTDYNTKDGTAVRDYIHVQDVAKAHLKAIQYQCNNQTDFMAFNVGMGRGYSVLEIIKAFEKGSEKKINYQTENRREGDVEQVWADNTKVTRTLNWKPQFDLEDMVRTTLEWEKNAKRL